MEVEAITTNPIDALLEQAKHILPGEPTVNVPVPEAESKEITVADKVHFPEVTLLRPCSAMECKEGHQWSPAVALARCGHGTPQGWNGCGNPILAVKMQNCPVCNEPAAKLKFRIDHTPPVPYPSPICIPGGKSVAEVITIEIPFRHAKSVEEPTQTKDNNGKE